MTIELLRRMTARTRIGLDLEQRPDDTVTVHAVAARGLRVQWRRELHVSPDEPLHTVLGSFLRALPGRRWLRGEVIVALSSPSVQVKRLRGLPALIDPVALSAAVRENASRFFLRNGIPIVTSGLRVDGPGDAWAAAAEQPLLESLELACHDAHIRLRAIVPAAAVLGPALAGTCWTTDPEPATPRRSIRMKTDAPGATGAPTTTIVVWPARSDAGTAQAATYAAGRLVALQPLRHLPTDVARTVLHDAASAALGADGWRFAAAYGAAVLGHREAIAWRPLARDRANVSAVRMRTAAAVCALAIIAAAFSPGVAATLAATRAAHHLHAVAVRRQEALRASDSINQVTTALREVTTFADDRYSVTVLLAQFTQMLPPQTALVAFHADSSGGTLVAITPSASTLLTSLEHVPGIAAPELVGPVTSEAIQPPSAGAKATVSHPLDRVTVRFRLATARVPTAVTNGMAGRGDGQ
jgi:hypothetical protein